jgi:hypothetical protein
MDRVKKEKKKIARKKYKRKRRKRGRLTYRCGLITRC